MSTDESQQPDPSEMKNEGYEIFIASLAILSIVNLVLLYVIPVPDMRNILFVMNALLTIVFLGDFFYRLFTAKSKSRYFWREFGWADLVSSLWFEQLKVFRLFRLVKVYRLMKEKGAKQVAKALFTNRAGSALLTLLLVGILMMEFGSLGMLRLEQDVAGANITSASDSMWYTVVTMSTVGYGDQYPVSNPGRVLGTVIIIVGVGIFGTLTGFLANAFLSPRRAKATASEEPDALVTQLATLKDLAAQQQAAIADLETQLGRRAG
jgi:voltage-gated potassium channel